MARLAGQFAGIVWVEAPAESVEALTKALEDLGGRGLTVTVRRPGAEAEAPAAQGEVVLTLQLLGLDRPGIVRDVSRALAAASVNVVELETQAYSAPMSGEEMFQADATLTAPAGTDVEAVREELEKIAERLALDLSLERALEV